MNSQQYKCSTLIKICGITNVQDAISAIELGADLIGLNLVGGPRKITPAAAEQIAAHPALVGKVVVLLDHWPPAWVVSAPLKTTIFGVQFYGPVGHPAVAQIRQQPFKLLLPVRVENAESLAAIHPLAMDSAGDVIWLLDAHVPGQLGGTGQTFDWTAAKSFARQCSDEGGAFLGVAGGLTPHNVADAMRQLMPHLVDVSSGVEEAGRPGIKSRALMRAFITAVRGDGQAASGGGKV